MKRYLIHLHIWNDNSWETVISGYCNLEKIEEYSTETNYLKYLTATIPGKPDFDRCIPNEVYFTEFIP